MKRSSLSNPASYQHWVMSHVGEEQYLIALLDPTRYEDIDTCVAALGFSQQEFEALPNLYEKYALTLRTHGPASSAHACSPFCGLASSSRLIPARPQASSLPMSVRVCSTTCCR